MAEIKENNIVEANGEEDGAVAAAASDDFAPVKAHEKAPESPPLQPVDVQDSAETDGREEPEPELELELELEPEPELEPAAQPADAPQEAEEEAPCLASAEPSTEPKWAIGAKCKATWSEDGQLYAGTLVWLDGRRCRVRFDGYGNEEEKDVSELKSPEMSPPPQTDGQVWKAGSRCCAVYSEDGLVYPAVLLWVRGERCRVRFDGYNNEEEQDVSSLLAPGELHGPGRATAAKGGAWRQSPTGSSSDWRRKRREESQAERDGERRPASSSTGKDRAANPLQAGRDAADGRGGSFQKDAAEKPAANLFSFFPPVPPPPNIGSAECVSFVPPPPPPPPAPPLCGRKEASGSADVDITTLSGMLMCWYMCGFHTGSYMAQQQCRTTCRPASSKD